MAQHHINKSKKLFMNACHFSDTAVIIHCWYTLTGKIGHGIKMQVINHHKSNHIHLFVVSKPIISYAPEFRQSNQEPKPPILMFYKNFCLKTIFCL